MVDGRYHRSPDKAANNRKKRMLGDGQFAWLLDGLRKSKAKFKVIASGSTLQDSKSDGWRRYTFSRHRLFDAIGKNKISGVLYMSGDVHRSHVWTHPESDRAGYPFIEVVSSGVANSKTLSYATVDFDTTAGDPTVRVRIVHGEGKTHDDKTWKLSELTAKEVDSN
jgi:phosphodiesterase/alkaline phosphatase D-like protein